jgi:PPOX class probable F420-dependent enzyme
MAYRRMTEPEGWAFLRTPPRPAVLSTGRADGRPHAAPVWYDIDGNSILFTTGADSIKGRNLARDPRLTLCVQDDQPPYSFVLVEGIAEMSDDVEQVRQWATRLGGRYMGRDRAEEFGIRNGVPGEHLVRVTPTRVIGFHDLAG